MYLQPSESVGSAAFPVVVVIAVSTIAAIAIAALLVLAIARRALERTTPDKVPIVIDALAAMLGQLGQYLPWSGEKGRAHSPIPGSPAQTTGNACHPELPEEEA